MLPLDQVKSDVASRYRRIAAAHADTVDNEILLARDWILRRPELRLALGEAAAAEPGLDFEEWHAIAQSRNFRWTARTEAGRATLVWQLVNVIADQAGKGQGELVLGYATRFTRNGVRGINELAEHVVDQVLRPLFEYLIEHVQAGQSSLLALGRYVARIEWYDREDLYARFESAVTANGQGEDALNLDLRRFLVPGCRHRHPCGGEVGDRPARSGRRARTGHGDGV